ncbi:MAG: hypothetical protein LBH32_03930 [Dysgonamonadaceae bacterium]|jgi:hypothetical protein|nr:hypothetical protein [Dysgonamonadaceae bacterium]
MKSFAAHYIYLPVCKIYKLHLITIDDSNRLKTICPLEKETAGIAFFNGVIIVLNKNDYSTANELINILNGKYYPEVSIFELLARLPLKEICLGSSVALYHLDGIDLSSAKFRADNSRSNCHIQRLC